MGFVTRIIVDGKSMETRFALNLNNTMADKQRNMEYGRTLRGDVVIIMTPIMPITVGEVSRFAKSGNIHSWRFFGIWGNDRMECR
jgi:hypothetical protein